MDTSDSNLASRRWVVLRVLTLFLVEAVSVWGQTTEIVQVVPSTSETHDSRFLLTTKPVVWNGADEHFPNPYYDRCQWKLWSVDESAVDVAGKKVRALEKDNRQFPSSGSLRSFAPQINASGLWDDAYLNQDNGHGSLRTEWTDGSDVLIPIASQAISSRVGPIMSVGANFTSQSTTGMGHDIANNGAQVRNVEQNYYFANALRMGPAHTSYYEYALDLAVDEYHAHFPTMYNSVGSSGSETWAISKMMIAGAYLDRELKDRIKKHGLYPATLLYLWKAGLPFNAPYEHELRHRLAYYSKGDHTDYKGIFQTEYNHDFHAYDERQHLENMVRLARELEHVPPVPVLDVKGIKGGEAVYGFKTCILAKQNASDVSLLVSLKNSYDVGHLPVSLKFMLLTGSKKTTVNVTTDPGVFVVTVPLDAVLPKGRTTVLVFADNGKSSSNPVAINVYRNLGKANKRPTVAKLKDRVVLPGENVEFEVTGTDPDFTDTRTYLMSGVGSFSGGIYRWKCPEEEPEGNRSLVFVVSDGCGGFTSRRVVLSIKRNRPVVEHSLLLQHHSTKMRLDSTKSAATGSEKITRRQWLMPDQTRPRSAVVKYDFGAPGVYPVKLAIQSKWGVDVASEKVEVKHDWPIKMERGWTKLGLNPSLWEETKSNGQIKIQAAKFAYPLLIKKSGEMFELQSKPIKPPLYLECDFIRRREKGSGISVFGVHIGHPLESEEGDPFGGDTSITLPGSEQKRIFVGRHARSSNHPSKLRLYVTKDPNSPNKLRFSGVLHADLDDYPFMVDGVVPVDDVFRVHCRGTFYLRNFKLWSPN